jgi:hypothetical protein
MFFGFMQIGGAGLFLELMLFQCLCPAPQSATAFEHVSNSWKSTKKLNQTPGKVWETKAMTWQDKD